MEYVTTEKFGFECLEFKFMGNEARIIKPSVKPNGKWVIKTEYADAFPEAEIELLRRGWHIAYNENDTRWAEPEDIDRKANFIRFISREFSLEPKCVAVGMSCGGLYAVKTAAKYPELFSALYLDAPVMNLLSCPCALGESKNRILYDEYVKCTGRTLVDLLSYREHPIDLMHILLENNMPILLISGDSDSTVPFAENGALLEKYYKDNGGNIKVYIKEGGDHHPHGLPDPILVADEIEAMVGL